MNSSILADEIIFIASDITSAVFLTVLIISITLEEAEHLKRKHLFAASFLVLAGVFLRIMVVTMEALPGGMELGFINYRILSVPDAAVWIVSFVFISCGITESVTHIIQINNDRDKSVLKSRLMITGIVSIVSAVAFALTDSITVLTIGILTLAGFFFLYLYRICSARASCEFGRACIPLVITFVLALVFSQMRLTGLGISLMLIIIAEQYHNHTAEELIKSEAALTKNKARLLAEQISPHYIYNSLQSISGLCGSDPDKAKEAIASFSDYLRGNLESLTAEDLIPFTRELEHTKAYLELEKLSGSRQFEVEYRLETTDFMVPPLVLQPIVENAVRHGAAVAAKDPDTGAACVTMITIGTRVSGGNICIEVQDCTGSRVPNTQSNVAEHAQGSKRKSIGLENVRERLALQCGGTLDMKSIDGGTEVIILIPAQNAAKFQQQS